MKLPRKKVVTKGKSGGKNIGRSLQQDEEYFRTLGEVSPVAIYRTDIEGNCIYANQRWLDLSGLSLEQTLGAGWVNAIHPADKEKVFDEWHRCVKSNLVFKMEYRLQCPDRKTAWFFGQATAERSSDGEITGYVGTLVDITERKIAEEELRVSEERYRSLVETSHDLICQCDLEGRFVYLNKAWETTLGYTAEEMLGRKFTEFKREKRAATDVKEFRRLAFGGSVKGYETVYISKTGEEVDVLFNVVPHYDSEGNIIGTQATACDITKLKNAEKALLQERDFAEQLFETAQCVELVLDTEGRIVRFNPHLEELSGYSLEEVKGKDWISIFIPGRDHEKIRKVFKAAMGDTRTVGYINPIQTKDGHEREIEWYGKTLKSADGTIIGVLAVGQDVTERKMGEEKLRESEERFHSFADASFEGICITERGKLIDSNSSFSRITGYNHDELVGIDVAKLVHPEDLELVRNNILAGYEQPYEHRSIHKDGSVIYLEVCGKPLKYRGRDCRITAIHDISGSKRLLEEIQEASEKYLASFNNSRDAINIFAENGTILNANSMLLELSGYTKAELLRMKMKTLYREATGGESAQRIQILLRGEDISPFETHLLTKNGKTVAVEVAVTMLKNCYGRAAVFQGNIRDITERKKAEEQIKELAKFPAENPNPVLRVSVDGILLHGNLASSSLMSDWKTEVGHPVPEHVASLVSSACSTGKAETMDILCCENLYSFVIAPVQSADYANLYGRDITEHRQLEDQLRQTEKMQAVGELAGGIAHDFNNQLTGVLVYADMLINGLEDEELGRYAANIKKAAKRAAELTQQLLAFSRKGKNLSVPVEIHKVLAEVTSILEHTIDKRIKVRQTLNASPATTIGDPSQLENVILNIALNARDAMPKGGELVFETDIVELDEDFCKGHANELLPGSYLKISVTDSGCGMDPETQKHIFEPFYTTKGVGKGTGMGLASVYGTVRNHKGAISVHSEAGRGTTFRIHLPLAEEAGNEQDASGRNVPVTGTARILLVDDEEMVRDLAADMLRVLGYTVTQCNNGKEAVEYYKKSWQHMDLVILDMVMPELGGRDTFIAMRNINPHVRAILSSGYSINDEAQAILDEGVMAFVEKPFELAEFSEKVAQVLRGGV